MGILKKLKRDLHVTDMWYDKMGASICLVNAQKGHPDKKKITRLKPHRCLAVFSFVSHVLYSKEKMLSKCIF